MFKWVGKPKRRIDRRVCAADVRRQESDGAVLEEQEAICMVLLGYDAEIRVPKGQVNNVYAKEG